MKEIIKKQEEDIVDKFIELVKMIVYSLIGIVVFFIPIRIDGESLTLIYHIADRLQFYLDDFLKLIVIIYISLGIAKTILLKKSESKKSIYVKLFSILIILNIFYIKKEVFLLDSNILLFLDSLIMNLVTVLPVNAMFATFLLDYGLLDIVESYTHNIMKKSFKLSGKVIVNILVYFFNDMFCGMYITNKLYKTGKIRESEACIIILTFSILSLPNIKYVCKELDLSFIKLMSISLIVLLIINLVLCRVYPLNKKKKSYYIKTNYKETLHKNDKLNKAVKKYISNKSKKNIFKIIIKNLEESISILMEVIPKLIILLYTFQIFSKIDIIIVIITSIFYPIINIFKIQSSNELSIFILNSFNNIFIAIDNVNKNIQVSTKYLIGVMAILSCTSISTIVYITCTSINISKKEFLFSYTQRIVAIIFTYCIMNYLYKGHII